VTCQTQWKSVLAGERNCEKEIFKKTQRRKRRMKKKKKRWRRKSREETMAE
jgi:hypothetical protein